jgi:Tfp pilus assembly protein PilN
MRRAARSPVSAVMDIDLMPRMSAWERYRTSLALVAVGVMGIATLCLTVLAWSRWQEEERTQALLAEVRSQQAEVTRETAALAKQWSTLQDVVRLAAESGPSVLLAPWLRQLWSGAPPGVTILSLEWNGNSVTLSGTAPSIPAVTRWQRSLAGMPEVSEAWVNEVHASDSGYAYSVVVRLTGKTGGSS